MHTTGTGAIDALSRPHDSSDRPTVWVLELKKGVPYYVRPASRYVIVANGLREKRENLKSYVAPAHRLSQPPIYFEKR